MARLRTTQRLATLETLVEVSENSSTSTQLNFGRGAHNQPPSCIPEHVQSSGFDRPHTERGAITQEIVSRCERCGPLKLPAVREGGRQGGREAGRQAGRQGEK